MGTSVDAGEGTPGIGDGAALRVSSGVGSTAGIVSTVQVPLS